MTRYSSYSGDLADEWLSQDARQLGARVWSRKVGREALQRALYREGAPSDDWVELASAYQGKGTFDGEAEHHEETVSEMSAAGAIKSGTVSGLLDSGGVASGAGYYDGCDCTACREGWWRPQRRQKGIIGRIRGEKTGAQRRRFDRAVGE